MPYWTAGRIANQIHHQVLAPHGFVRRGRQCERRAGGLRKTCDSLGGTPHTPTGRLYYPLPNSTDPLPPDLLGWWCDQVDNAATNCE